MGETGQGGLSGLRMHVVTSRRGVQLWRGIRVSSARSHRPFPPSPLVVITCLRFLRRWNCGVSMIDRDSCDKRKGSIQIGGKAGRDSEIEGVAVPQFLSRARGGNQNKQK